jgi:hypothetical protein
MIGYVTVATNDLKNFGDPEATCSTLFVMG